MDVVKISEELHALAFLHQVFVHHLEVLVEEVHAVTSEIHAEEELVDSETHVEHQEDGILDVKVALVHHAEILSVAAAIVVQVVLFLTIIMVMVTDVQTIMV